jgi:hypothetical protein
MFWSLCASIKLSGMLQYIIATKMDTHNMLDNPNEVVEPKFIGIKLSSN